jgi:hypothetical protein
MTGRELAGLIGRDAAYRVAGLTMAVRVVDARTRFGGVDVLISPVAGSGEQWVQVDSVRMMADNINEGS